MTNETLNAFWREAFLRALSGPQRDKTPDNATTVVYFAERVADLALKAALRREALKEE